ncbi:MAG: hypothetical protein DLM54_08070 [Acidimicrobiales bacterium]|nr:MAG: hypothetical protein DLM54_08070 [Acidimicrobiales bacterium]
MGTVAPSPLWYLTRGTGAVVLLLLTASVVLGIAGTARWGSARWPRFVIGTLHRNISLLVLVLLGIHIVTAVTDTFAGIRWIDTVVPFTSGYRALWLGLGTLALDLLVSLAVTSALRQRLGYRAWKSVHWLAYASWPIAVVHGLGTGSDAKSAWLLALTAICTIAVVAAVWWRVAVGWPAHRRIRVGAVAASLLAPVAGGVWLVVGPLHAGWARRAGTPSAVLARVSSPAPASSASQPSASQPSSSANFPSRFSAQLAGTASQSSPAADGSVTVTLATTLSGGTTGRLVIVLRGQPSGGGGVAVTSSRASLGTAADPNLYRGTVASLRGGQISLVLTDTDGSALDVSVRVQVDAAAGTVTGTAQAAPSTARANSPGASQ